ncbi:hypothetical protein THAOC_31839, partial [Thalassiosira oceanica]
MVCTFDDEGPPERDACDADSGGPLVYNNGKEDVQVGVVSWGPPDCQVEPGVYARVSE